MLGLGGCEAEIPAVGGPSDGEPGPLGRITQPVDGGTVHLVRLVQRGDRYAFQPPELELEEGDVLRFVMIGGQPESVAFDPAEASAEAAAFILSKSLHLGILLTDTGQAYDVSFEEAPPGRYPFLSIPHVGSGMRGVAVVRDD